MITSQEANRINNRNPHLEDVVREPMIPKALSQQLELLQNLGGLYDTLEERLARVSRSEPSPSNIKEPVDHESNCILSIVERHNRHIQLLCNRIQESLRLLEV